MKIKVERRPVRKVLYESRQASSNRKRSKKKKKKREVEAPNIFLRQN